MTDTNTITSSSTLPYKCPPLIDLSPEKEKKILPPSECTSLFSQFSFSHKSIDPSHLYFFYYDCESIHDYGWGCAWRALQTTLRFLLAQSNKYTNSTDMTYKTLFMKYGERQMLEELYIKEYQPGNTVLPDYIVNTKFCPFESMKGWAEPFIAKLVISDFGFKGELLLVNNAIEQAYAPKEVFNRVITFYDFVEMVKKHFENPKAAPIIIDDSLVCLCIGGVGKEESDGDDAIRFIMLDPHVRQNNTGDSGIYYVVIEKDGTFKKEKNKQHNILGHLLHFKKGWMVYIPDIIE